MVSNVISDIKDEFLVCHECLEDLKQPKMLPCLHTFCQPCLERLLATEPVGKLDCPTCRQDVPLTENGVQGLKSNFLVGKLRDILQQQPKEEKPEAREDGIPFSSCTACEAANLASFYCVECTDYLCQTCNDTHGRFKATRSHIVVNIQDSQADQVATDDARVRTSLRSSQIRQVRSNVRIAGANLKHIKTVREGGSGDVQFSTPYPLAVTAEGDIVVTEINNSGLKILDKDGSFRKKVDLWFMPECVAALTNGELLVTGDGHRIHVLDKQGRELRIIQVTGAAETDKTTKGIAVDGLGRIIVTIGYQVFVLSRSGDVMLKFGDKGQVQQQLGPFLHVVVNSSNQIIVSDHDNHDVKIFDPAGRHLFTSGSFGFEPGQLNYPSGVITDSDDNIIVAETYNHRVSLFSPDGAFIRHVLTRDEHGLLHPGGLALSHDGHLVVSDCLQSVKFFRG
ncbi:tripartite motif-containing protein 3-like [Branchiostoma floridae]|uniref:RING-type E3 ubiquitin transferase n=1 Tax=Branchiostoma floridae TaxID=7739 RepID=A0A9J7LGA8_BRAFL|nr:tripartite motif-containing protein 3-like [Branchiostoma floridae]